LMESGVRAQFVAGLTASDKDVDALVHALTVAPTACPLPPSSRASSSNRSSPPATSEASAMPSTRTWWNWRSATSPSAGPAATRRPWLRWLKGPLAAGALAPDHITEFTPRR
jgi:hypothetical protein